jgi:nicotinate-nucleotide--dimethylbenzimidazole phosphoribosyltransferase
MTAAATINTSDEFRGWLAALPGPDAGAAAAAAARQAALLKPAGALGRLEALAAWLAAWQGRHPPGLDRISVIVFAGSHGVAAQRVSLYPAAVTRQMVAGFHAGHAAINQLCRQIGADLEVVAIELEAPTADITLAPAMDEAGFVRALNAGLAAADRAAAAAADLVCLGEMGIANTTTAAALALALGGGRPEAWTGAGTGLDAAGRAAKAAVVGRAAARHRSQAADALDLLRRLGGRELAAIAGAVIGARRAGIPVVLDGYTATAAAAPLAFARRGALDHCLVGHLSAEPGHRLLLDLLGMPPLLDLGLRLGEASGAVLAAQVLKAAVACHTGMATFAEAGVSGADAAP